MTHSKNCSLEKGLGGESNSQKFCMVSNSATKAVSFCDFEKFEHIFTMTG